MGQFLHYSHLQYLDSFLLFNSNDYQITKDKISQYLCPHEFDVEAFSHLNTRLNGFSFGNSALYELKYSAPVEITIDGSSKNYLFRITLDGQCKVQDAHHQVFQSVGIMTVTHPNCSNHIVTNHLCCNLILKVTQQDVETQLYKMLGYTCSEPVIFDSGMTCTDEGLSSIIETLNYLCHAYYHIENWNFISESFTQYLIELILLKVPNNYSSQLKEKRKCVLPHYMKKAQQYIQQHIQQTIGLSDLSEFCDVSGRSLQKGFNQYFQQTPMEYIRDVRMALVHQALLKSKKNSSVTDILLQHGIQSLGHFSTHYKKRYGCLPSQTLKMHQNSSNI